VQLTGQVLDKQAVQPRQNVAVDLSTDEDQLLGTTVANAFGEFQMEFEAKEFVWLSITAGSRNTVWVPLTILR
jgi:5-hydroxyisourate hydrolase-like protein (transthyretin family)